MANASETNSVRTTGRIKKPKAVFDPSDYYIPRNQRVPTQSSLHNNSSSSTSGTSLHGQQQLQQNQTLLATATSSTVADKQQRPSCHPVRNQPTDTKPSTAPTSVATSVNFANPSSIPSTDLSAKNNADICFVCMKREPKRGTYINRTKLINCVGCPKKVHRLCLKLEFENLNNLRQNYQCDSCRSCEICLGSISAERRADTMVTCVKCVKSYHSACHLPALTKQQRCQRNWKCSKCTRDSTSGHKNINVLLDNIRNNSAVKVANSMVSNENTRTGVAPQSGDEKKSINRQVPPVIEVQQQQETPSGKLSKSKCGYSTTPLTTSFGSSAATVTQHKIVPTIPPSSNDELKVRNVLRRPKLEDSSGIPPLKMINNNDSLPSGIDGNKNGIGAIVHQTADSLKLNVKKKAVGEGNVDEQPKGVAVPSCSSIPSSSSSATLNRRYISEEPDNVPDVKSWSVDQVADYFAKYFPNEAHVFRDQEIDGMSLLLLKRSDIVMKLPFKLGPSLRLYSFILKIQTKLNDSTLGWHMGAGSP